MAERNVEMYTVAVPAQAKFELPIGLTHRLHPSMPAKCGQPQQQQQEQHQAPTQEEESDEVPMQRYLLHGTFDAVASPARRPNIGVASQQEQQGRQMDEQSANDHRDIDFAPERIDQKPVFSNDVAAQNMLAKYVGPQPRIQKNTDQARQRYTIHTPTTSWTHGNSIAPTKPSVIFKGTRITTPRRRCRKSPTITFVACRRCWIGCWPLRTAHPRACSCTWIALQATC